MNTKDLKDNLGRGIKVVKKIGKKISDVINEVKESINYNYFDYIDEYGDYTFEEREFNEVDNVILSMLTYVDYNGIVSENDKDKKSVFCVSKEFFSKHNKSELKKAIIPTKMGIKLLDKISRTRRYRDVLLFNYLYVGSPDSQFSALTFDLGNRLYFIGFEGTDTLISGWEEDCKMAYTFPVEAHKLAKKYLRKYTFKNAKLIIGGHSKGGNLALVSSMYTNFLVRWKIKRIYSNDGMGLRDEQMNSRKYKRIENRFIRIIPDSSIVGLLLRHKDNYIVIKSNMPGLISHDTSTWQIDRDTFSRTNLTRFSKVFDDGFSRWLDKYNDEERELFVKEVFDVMRENKIETLLDFSNNYMLIFNVLKSSKKLDIVVKDMAKDLIKVITQTNLEYPLFK